MFMTTYGSSFQCPVVGVPDNVVITKDVKD
jgi:hypothetical protein